MIGPLWLRVDDAFARAHPEDIARIVAVMARNGYFILPEVAGEAWHRHSRRIQCEDWLELPERDGWIVQAILDETR